MDMIELFLQIHIGHRFPISVELIGIDCYGLILIINLIDLLGGKRSLLTCLLDR